jgi:uncharacterized Zn finger protein
MKYHEWGQVVERKQIGATVMAKVSGSRAYRVEIRKNEEACRRPIIVTVES